MFLLRGFLDFLTAIVRRPKFLGMTIIIVLASVLLIGIYGTRVVTNIPVYVVDHDNSTISRTIRNFLAAGTDIQMMGAIDSMEEAQELFMNGEAAAIVYIPKGLSENVKTQQGGHVITYLDGANLLTARNADKAIQTVVKTVSVGIGMITVQKAGLPDYQLIGALQPINLDVDRPFNTLTSYSDYLLPVFLFFNLSIFIILLTCGVFQEPIPDKIKEHKIRKRWYYFGRLLAVFILSFIGGLLIYMYGLPRVDIVLQSSPLMALSALAIFIIITQLLYSTINLTLPIGVAMSLSYIIAMLSVMFSGMTWPLEMMPWYIHGFATWIPLTPFLQSLQVFLYHDANWADLSQFLQMFLKQAILYTLLIFIIMRFKDIILFLKWCFSKFKKISQPAPVAETAGIPVHVAIEADHSENSANADKSIDSDSSDDEDSDNEETPIDSDISDDEDTEDNSENINDLENNDSSSEDDSEDDAEDDSEDDSEKEVKS